jgi:hypothetical protein
LEAERRCGELTVDQVLAWADDHHAATGRWPSSRSGPVQGVPYAVTWNAVDSALRGGYRGLPGDSSLARLLAEHRLVPGPVAKEPLRIHQILAWADVHHAATGKWPNEGSGPVRAAPFSVTWSAVDVALKTGLRGLPGGTTLSRLLARHRQVRRGAPIVVVTVEQIIAWSKEHHRATGAWPTVRSGPVRAAPPLTWSIIDDSLSSGRRGLPGGSTLAVVLAEHRRAEALRHVKRFQVEQILAWADAHHAATGKWPTTRSGPVRGLPATLTWKRIDRALQLGIRSLSTKSSLAQLLFAHRGAAGPNSGVPLTIEQILTWADAYHATHGRWPKHRSGPIPGTAGETWKAMELALTRGSRGLPGGSSLFRLLVQYRNATLRRSRPRRIRP